MSESQKKALPGCSPGLEQDENTEWDIPFVDSDIPVRPSLPGWYDQDLKPPKGGRYASRTDREVCDAFGLAKASLSTLYETGLLTWTKDGLLILSRAGVEALRRRKRYSGCLQSDVKLRLEIGKESQRGALWLNETSSKQFGLARANGTDRWGRPNYFVQVTEKKTGWEDGRETLRDDRHMYDRRHGGWRNWNSYIDY